MAFTRRRKSTEPGALVHEAPVSSETQVEVVEVLTPPQSSASHVQVPPPAASAMKFYQGDREAIDLRVKIITTAAARLLGHTTDPLALRRDFLEIQKASMEALAVLQRY